MDILWDIFRNELRASLRSRRKVISTCYRKNENIYLIQLFVCYIWVGSPFLNVLSSQRLYIFSTMAQSEDTNTIKLISCDNREFVVDKKVAFMSELVKQLYAVSPDTSGEIVIPDVKGDILDRVITFCIDFFPLIIRFPSLR